jgi:hypothetical protein
MENTLNGEKSIKTDHISVYNKQHKFFPIDLLFFSNIGLIKPKKPSNAFKLILFEKVVFAVSIMFAANDQARTSKRAVKPLGWNGQTVAIARSDTVHDGSAG